MKYTLSHTLFSLVAVAMFTAGAQAAVVSFTINMQYTGDQPDGFLTLEFSDEAEGLEAGEVKLTLTGALEGAEDVKTLGFNIDPGQADDDADETAINNLSFSDEMTTGGFAGGVSITKGLNNQQGDLGPQGGFDVLFDFGGGNPDDRFNENDTLMYIISSSIDLNANMFDATNDVDVAAAAHIRATDGQFGSGKIKDGSRTFIPSPAALPAGLAMLLLTASRRRRAA